MNHYLMFVSELIDREVNVGYLDACPYLFSIRKMIQETSTMVGGRSRIRDRQFTLQKRAQEKPLRKKGGAGGVEFLR